jgi:hypothetical protein
MPRFSELANTKVEDINPPKPLPPGDYICLVDGVPEFKEGISARTNEPWESYNYRLRPVTALESVDSQKLQEAEGLNDKALFIQFFQPHQLKNFLEACGVKMKGKTLPECIAASPGCQVQVNVTNKPHYRDKSQLAAEVSSYTTAS